MQITQIRANIVQSDPIVDKATNRGAEPSESFADVMKRRSGDTVREATAHSDIPGQPTMSLALRGPIGPAATMVSPTVPPLNLTGTVVPYSPTATTATAQGLTTTSSSGGVNPASMQTMMQQSADQQMQMLQVQQQMSNQTTAFQTESNILKAENDAENTAVQNIKS